MATLGDTARREKRASQSASFPKFARNCVRLAGHPFAFGLAFTLVIVWAVTGPIFKFSDTWQLAINTGTTIVTFVMVFLIQNSQNRDSEAIQLKLAELIRATQSAHNAFLDIEELSKEELERIKVNLGQLAREAREDLRNGKSSFGCPHAKPVSEYGGFSRWELTSGKSERVNGATLYQTKENI